MLRDRWSYSPNFANSIREGCRDLRGNQIPGKELDKDPSIGMRYQYFMAAGVSRGSLNDSVNKGTVSGLNAVSKLDR